MDKRIKVTVWGALINIFLAGLKISVGLFGRSLALVADGLHSLSDLISDIVVILGVVFGRKAPDMDHQFGHKKFENLAEFILGIILIMASVKIGYDAITHFFSEQEFTQPAFITIFAASISVLLKETIFHITKKTATETDSDSLLANAWHHRSDALTSLAVLIGLAVGHFFPNITFIDGVLSILISMIIIKIGIQIIINSGKKLSDISPGTEFYKEIKKHIGNHNEVKDVHALKMRYIGNEICIEVHIEVNPQLTVQEGHAIATEIKEGLLENYDKICEVMIHIEPEGDHEIHNDNLEFD